MGFHFIKQVKIIVCGITSLFMIIGIFQLNTIRVKAVGNVTEIFDDVQEGAWYADSVQFVYDSGLMVGMGNRFGINEPLKREQFVQVLYAVAWKPSVGYVGDPFWDLNRAPYAKEAIYWAYKNRVARGNANGEFGVGQPIQRQAVAVMLYKFTVLMGGDTNYNNDVLNGYTDSSKISNWAVESMKWAVTNGIISGKDNNTLDPLGQTTRAECAVMIKNFIAHNSKEIQKGDIVKMGKWEQDLTVKGKEDNEWLVINVEEDRILVISKYNLMTEKHFYVDELSYPKISAEEVTWETSALRKDLNEDFYNYEAGFTDYEKRIIPTVTIVNKDNHETGRSGGNNTQDKIFCLSVEEYEQYISGLDPDLICPPGTQAQMHQGYHYRYWWLRSPGILNSAWYVAYAVSPSGLFYGCNPNIDHGVPNARPAMYILKGKDDYYMWNRIY